MLVFTILIASLAFLTEGKPEPDVSHLIGLFPPQKAYGTRHNSRQTVFPEYSTINEHAPAPIGYAKVTPPPHQANKVISELIGNCSCPAMKMACDPIVIYRENPRLVEVPGERKLVQLSKERLQEIPLKEPVVLTKEYLDVQRLQPQIRPQTVEVIREVLREEVEYYDLIVDRIEIQYNDVVKKVILEVEEPNVLEEYVDEPVRVQLREEVLNIIDQPEKVWLTEEIPQQVNETIRIRQTFYDIKPIADERVETINCDNYRIVKVPRDDCAQPINLKGYLPPP